MKKAEFLKLVNHTVLVHLLEMKGNNLTENYTEKLQNINDYRELLGFINTHRLKRIGTGEYRNVYDFGNNTVLKVVKNINYIDTNYHEDFISKCMTPTYAIQVLARNDSYLWIVTEKIKPLSKEALIQELYDKLYSEETKTSINAVKYFDDIIDSNAKNLDMPHIRKFKYGDVHDLFYKNNAWYRGLIEKITQCTKIKRDFHLANWGLRPATNELVIFDLGGVID